MYTIRDHFLDRGCSYVRNKLEKFKSESGLEEVFDDLLEDSMYIDSPFIDDEEVEGLIYDYAKEWMEEQSLYDILKTWSIHEEYHERFFDELEIREEDPEYELWMERIYKWRKKDFKHNFAVFKKYKFWFTKRVADFLQSYFLYHNT